MLLIHLVTVCDSTCRVSNQGSSPESWCPGFLLGWVAWMCNAHEADLRNSVSSPTEVTLRTSGIWKQACTISDIVSVRGLGYCPKPLAYKTLFSTGCSKGSGFLSGASWKPVLRPLRCSQFGQVRPPESACLTFPVTLLLIACTVGTGVLRKRALDNLREGYKGISGKERAAVSESICEGEKHTPCIVPSNRF